MSLIGNLPVLGADVAKVAAADEAMVLIEAGDYVTGFKRLKAQAREDDAFAQFTLAVMYQIGAGVEVDLGEASVHVRRAAAAGSRQAARWLIEAVGARDADYFDWYRVSMGAEGFDTIPPASLATPQAGGVRFNLEAITAWADEVAAVGNSIGLYNQSRRALVQVAQDEAQLAVFREKLLAAAEAGSGRACRDVADCYTAGGLGFSRDPRKAESYLLLGAEAGDVACQYRMARGYAFAERGRARDLDQAREWFELAAAQGQLDAINQLGDLLRDTSYKGFDGPRGFELAQRAAELGDPFADGDLALCYLEGWCTERDATKAVGYFRKMVDRGDGWAAEQLARLYLDGTGVSEDQGEAVRLLEIAAEQDRVGAQRQLAGLYQTGPVKFRDEARAFGWFERAARLGDGEAQYQMSVCLSQGRGVAPDAVEAGEWRRLAAAKGNAKALKVMGKNPTGSELRMGAVGSGAPPVDLALKVQYDAVIRAGLGADHVLVQAELKKLFNASAKNPEALRFYALAVMALPKITGVKEKDLVGRLLRAAKKAKDPRLTVLAAEVALTGPGGLPVEVDRGFKLLSAAAETEVEAQVSLVMWRAKRSGPIFNLKAARTLFDRFKGESVSFVPELKLRLGLYRNQVPDLSAAELTARLAEFENRTGDGLPVAVFRCAPQYPVWERLAEMTATVTVALVVDKQGVVVDVHCEEGEDSAFAREAMAAVKRWRFAPGLKGGNPVNTRMRVPIVFNVTDF